MSENVLFWRKLIANLAESIYNTSTLIQLSHKIPKPFGTGLSNYFNKYLHLLLQHYKPQLYQTIYDTFVQNRIPSEQNLNLMTDSLLLLFI